MKQWNDWLSVLDDDEAVLAARFQAFGSLCASLSTAEPRQEELVRAFDPVYSFWKRLRCDDRRSHRNVLAGDRLLVAWACDLLARERTRGPMMYAYYPLLPDVEGPHPADPDRTVRGPMAAGYGTSAFEFHWEYPIAGIGVRKDQITVIGADDQRTRLLDWCRENQVIVYCNRCGLDITYEVSTACPARGSWPFS